MQDNSTSTVAHDSACTGRILLRKIATLVFIAAAASMSIQADTHALGEDKRSAPNIVIMFTDDKNEGYYEGIKNCVRIDGNHPKSG